MSLRFAITGDNKNVLNSFSEVQQGVRRMSTSVEQSGQSIESMFSRVKTSALSGIKQLMAGVAGFTALMESGSFIKNLYSDMGKFNIAMREVSTLSEDVTANLEDYKRKVVELTTEIAIAPDEAAKALYQIESAGHHGADGLNVLRESAKGAIGGVTETAIAADAITTILNSYKMDASEAARVNDLLFTTVRLGKTTYDELGRVIAQVTPIAAAFSVSIDEVLAAIASLTKSGTKTSIAVRQVRDAITATTNSLGDGTFKTRSFLDAMDEVAEKAKGSESSLKQDLNKLSALNAVLALTGENAKSARQDFDEMQNSQGAAEAAYQKMAETTESATKRLRNNIFAYFLPLGDEIRSMGKGIAESMNEAFDTGSMQKALAALEGFIAAYAVYRGMLASVNLGRGLSDASMIAATNAAYDAELAQLQALVPLKEAEAKSDLDIAVAEGRLTQEKAEAIMAMRAEAQAHLQNLQSIAAETTARFNEATSIVANTSLRLEEANAAVATAEMKYNAALSSGEATAIESAELELNTAISNRNNVAKQLQAEREIAAAAATDMNTASTAAESAAMVIDSTASKANATSTGILAGAKLKLKKAIDMVNSSFLASPLFWMAATIVGVTYGIYKLVTAETAAEAATRKANEAMEEQNKLNDKRREDVQGLLRTIQDQNASEIQQIEAYEELKKIMPDITDKYTRQALAAMNASDSQKELNEALDGAEYDDVKKKIDELETKLAKFDETLQTSMKNAGQGAGNVAAAAYKEKAVMEENLRLLYEQLHKINDLRSQASDESRPIEIRIKEANDNIRVREEILGFYNKAKDLADNWQLANEQINYTTGKTRLEEFIELAQSELEDLRRQQEENPMDMNLELKASEIQKILNNVLDMKADMEARGTTTVPILFQADMNSLQVAIGAARNYAQGLIQQTVAGGATTLQQDFNSAQTRWLKAQDRLNKIMANKSKYTREDLVKAQSELKTAKEDYEGLGGDTKGRKGKTSKSKGSGKKEDTAAREAAQLRQKQFDMEQEQLERQARDREQLIESNANLIISKEKDATLRELKQREKDHKDRLEAIQKQADEWKKEAYEAAKEKWEAENKDKNKVFADTDTGKATWSAQSLTETQQAIIDAQIEKEKQDWENAQRELSESLIASHQSYTDQKIAIDKTYYEESARINSAIRMAEEQGDTQMAEALKRSLAEVAKERAKSQGELSLNILKETPEYIRAFEDLGQTSSETLELLISQFEEAKDAAAQSMEPKDLREFTDTLQQMYDELDSRDPFKAMKTSLMEVRSAHREVIKAERDLKTIQSGGIVTVRIYDKELDKFVDTVVTEEEALKKVAKAKDKEAKANTKYKKASKDASEVIENLATSIQNVGGAIGGMMGEIVGLIGDITSVVNGALHAMENTSQGASAAIQAAEKASAILAIISAAIQVIQKISGLVKNLFGANDAKDYEKAKQRYENLSAIWDELIEKKREYLNESWGKEVMGAEEEARSLLKIEEEQIRLLAQQRLKVTNGSHSMWYRMWKGSYKFNGQNWQDVAGEISRTLNVTFNSMEDMTNMTSEQLQWIKENYVGLWSVMDSDFREHLEKIISFAKTEKDIIDETMERMTTTGADSVFDDFMDSLYELADGSEDVMQDIADNWQQMVNRMVINNLIGESMKSDLKDWYNQLYEVNRQRVTDSLSDEQYKEELDRLSALYNSYVESGKQQIEQLSDMGIIKSIAKVEEEVEEETKGYLDSVRSAYMQLISDSEIDIDKWTKDLRNTILRNLMESKLLDEEFDKWATEWSERYYNILNAYDGGNIQKSVFDGLMDDLMAEFNQRTGEIADKSKMMWEAFGFDEEQAEEAEEVVENAFKDLHSSFLSTLTDMKDDAEAWSKQITKTMVEQLVEKNILDETFDKQMDEWRERFENAVTAGDTEGLKALRKELEEIRGSLAEQAHEYMEALGYVEEAVEEAVEEKVETPFDNLRGSFLSTITDMEADAEDFANDIGKILTEAFVDKFVLGEAFEQQLEYWKQQYGKIMDSGMGQDQRAKALRDLKDEIAGAREDYAQQAREIMELFGTGNTYYGDQQASVNMADKATYDQFELFLGMQTAMMIGQEQGNAVRLQILQTLQTMGGLTSMGASNESRNMMMLANEYLLDIKRSNREMLDQFSVKLDSINQKLSRL